MSDMDEATARERFAAGRVARLATVGGAGRPHLVPVCFAVDGDCVFTAVDAKPKRGPDLKRLDNIRSHSDVTVLVDHYEEAWDRVWWVRADGRARVVEEGPDVARAHDLLRRKYEQYRGQTALLDRVVVIDVVTWRWWTSSSAG